MSHSGPELRPLRRALVAAFPAAADLVRVATAAGVPRGAYTTTGSPENTWQDVLWAANARDLVDALRAQLPTPGGP